VSLLVALLAFPIDGLIKLFERLEHSPSLLVPAFAIRVRFTHRRPKIFTGGLEVLPLGHLD
jgi:hypothetical protein